jgi:tetratricopeptide (TPR) repeat protein
VAKLLIYRGQTPHAEVELSTATVRIGRNAQNDIVLEDPSKGVSRTHAEIRFEGGDHILVDRESQNGIWVSGSRVSSVVLAPHVVASVGPFRLMIEAPAVAVYAADTPTEYNTLADRPTGPLTPDDAPVIEPRAQRPHDTAQPTGARAWHQQPRTWFIAGAAVLLIAAVGYAAYKALPKGTPPAFDLVLARAMVDGGKCDQAVVEHITPALSANPDDAAALELRRRCTASAPLPPPESTAAPATTADEPAAAPELDQVETLIAANGCSEAVQRVDAVLASDPSNARAQELAARAAACAAAMVPAPTAPAPPAPGARTGALATKEPPSQGGLDLLPQELAKDYQKRKLAMRKRYDDAVAMLQRQEHQQAARAFDEIAQEVPTGYIELAQGRADAHEGIKQQAAKAFDLAQSAEKAGQFEAATDAYRRANALDPSIRVDGALQRIEEQKIARGRKRCDDAKVAFSYGENAAATTAFHDVLTLLPPSDPCHTLAVDRLKQLGK